MNRELNDAIIAKDLIIRIEVIRSFLNKGQRKKVAETYRTHSYRKTKGIKSLKDYVNDAPFSEDYIWIDNPDGSNFALSVKHLKTILKNYNFVFKEGLSVN